MARVCFQPHPAHPRSIWENYLCVTSEKDKTAYFRGQGNESGNLYTRRHLQLCDSKPRETASFLLCHCRYSGMLQHVPDTQ